MINGNSTTQHIHGRRIRPGDKVLIYDGLSASNVWIIIDDVLFTDGRTKLRSANMEFYFDEGLVVRHQKKSRGTDRAPEVALMKRAR